MKQMTNIKQANKRLVRNLFIVAVAMFGFGYLLAPMYDVICKVTGLNGKTGRIEATQAAAGKVDKSRVVTVEFTGNANSGLPWEFRPLTKQLSLHPGETAEVKYYVRNLASENITGQAIPSVTPGDSAGHFKKIECFCFTQQMLKPGEAREMPVKFYVDADLDKDIKTITLSYAFFNTDTALAKKYGGAAIAQTENHADHAAHSHPASGS
ncbi:MAG: cytochrome c oxidase assembly protein [Gammaproteobacteria bacterium]|nr:cytochrome c oxidase assembly protein [Gammaproteobacteria bacterium]